MGNQDGATGGVGAIITKMKAAIIAGDIDEANKMYWLLQRSPQFMDRTAELDRI